SRTVTSPRFNVFLWNGSKLGCVCLCASCVGCRHGINVLPTVYAMRMIGGMGRKGGDTVGPHIPGNLNAKEERGLDTATFNHYTQLVCRDCLSLFSFFLCISCSILPLQSFPV